jgi:hypothetical protein
MVVCLSGCMSIPLNVIRQSEQPPSGIGMLLNT